MAFVDVLKGEVVHAFSGVANGHVVTIAYMGCARKRWQDYANMFKALIFKIRCVTNNPSYIPSPMYFGTDAESAYYKAIKQVLLGLQDNSSNCVWKENENGVLLRRVPDHLNYTGCSHKLL